MVGVGAKGAREVVGTVPELRVVPAGLWQAVKAMQLPTNAVHAVPVALRELLDRRVTPHEEGRPGGLGEAGTPAEGGEKGAEERGEPVLGVESSAASACHLTDLHCPTPQQ